MSNEQLFLAIGVPILFNGLALLLVTITLNSRINDLVSRVASLEQRMAGLEQRLGGLASKDDLRCLQEVLDVRLKRIEAKLEKR